MRKTSRARAGLSIDKLSDWILGNRRCYWYYIVFPVVLVLVHCITSRRMKLAKSAKYLRYAYAQAAPIPVSLVPVPQALTTGGMQNSKYAYNCTGHLYKCFLAKGRKPNTNMQRYAYGAVVRLIVRFRILKSIDTGSFQQY